MTALCVHEGSITFCTLILIYHISICIKSFNMTEMPVGIWRTKILEKQANLGEKNNFKEPCDHRYYEGDYGQNVAPIS